MRFSTPFPERMRWLKVDLCRSRYGVEIELACCRAVELNLLVRFLRSLLSCVFAMQPFLGLLLFLLSFNSGRAATPHKRDDSIHNYYVVELDPRAGTSLPEVARYLGVQVVERAGELDNFWLVRADKFPHGPDARDPVLGTVDAIRRQSSATLHSRSPAALHARQLDQSIRHISFQDRKLRVKRAPPPIRPGDENDSAAVATKIGIADPRFPNQWHLVNDEYPEHSMNVSRLWEEGVTGKGVISALVDDGLDYESRDLADNFVRCTPFLASSNTKSLAVRARLV
jgi:kexin